MKYTRHIAIRTEQSESNDMVITVTPIVFNRLTEINDLFGGYTEVIQRKTLDGLDLNDTRLLVNHEYSRIPLAKTPKTMELWTDNEGLHMRAILPDTEEGRSVYTAVSRGDMSGMSFSFTCDKTGSHFN